MKKILCLFLALCLCIPLVSCKGKENPKGNADLSNLPFVNAHWERHTESCTETIYFNDDGSCGYYCACGNPVNDDDLCEGYSFDDETQTIYLDFAEKTSETVTKIQVKSCDGETLVLDFAGDLRTFEKVSEEEEYAPDTLEYEGHGYTYLTLPGDIFYYDLANSVEYWEDEYLPIPHEKWGLVYLNGDLFILDEQLDDATALYADRESYVWSVAIEHPDWEDSKTYPLTVTQEENDYIYAMEDEERDTTLHFNDIELFATLIKTSKDGLIAGSTSLAYNDGVWYWRSEVIDESAEGWPEYVIPLPEGISQQIDGFYEE